MVSVVCVIELNPGCREAFLNEFAQIVPAVRAEDGCLDYRPTIDTETDIDRQAPMRDNSVTVIERWESIDALKAHLVAPHMLTYREKIKDYVAGASLHILEDAVE
ncbi:MAG: antibiotic biosynthesis monooxygenase [Planctomycetaceae bacterium]|nr:antibiotic biosynthesis monooxygenase [Planctomycetaceae bacterium]